MSSTRQRSRANPVLAAILLPVLALSGVPEDEDQETEMVRESEHFTIITCEPEPDYLDDIVAALEGNYQRVVGSLGMEGEIARTAVRIYPTIEEFHRAVNMVGAPNWALGSIWSSSEFRIASPMSPGLPVSCEDMTRKLPVHEFAHVVVSNIVNPESIPYWLWEGISLYMAGQRVDLSRLGSPREGEFPSFEELSSMPNSFQFGYSLVEFIVARWGVDTLKDLLMARGDVAAAYGISPEGFHDDWRGFVTGEYLR